MMDVIDTLADIVQGSTLDTLRALRPQARVHSQASFQALFAPEDPADMSLAERAAVAAFVAGLHGQPETVAFYDANLAKTAPELQAPVAAEIAAGVTHGPYGAYPAGRLSIEDVRGPLYHVTPSGRSTLGPRLSAAFAQAHLLVFHPRDASPAPLQAMRDAGWSTTGVVTFSQLVAFLAYQIRVAAGLRTLARHPRPEGQP